MKHFNLIILLFISTFAIFGASAQNCSINLLTQNFGLVNNGGTVFLEITINNTDPVLTVPSYKLRPQISVPAIISSVPTTGHILPPGWAFTFNSGSVFRLTNGTDNIGPNDFRTILIAVQGNAIGGPFTISGNLFFGNGVAPGAASGVALPGDLTADNVSQSTIQVTNTTPLSLLNFNAGLVNCQPLLNWTTETEVNSNRFEIERTNQNSANWTRLGEVRAGGNSAAKLKYTFTDNNTTGIATDKVLYRLKIIDNDGRYKYSAVLPVFIDCKKMDVYAYPNPVNKGNLHVSITGSNDITEAALFSVSGQMILRTNLRSGTNVIDVANVADGTYILSVHPKNGESRKIKVIIQH